MEGYMVMKRIVMVCDSFAPKNGIGAVRTTKLAKYFRRYGYEVVVFAEQKQGYLEDEILQKDSEEIKVYRVMNSKYVQRFISAYERIILPVKKKRYDNLDDRMRVNKFTGSLEFHPFQTAHPIIGSLDFLIELLRQYDLYWSSRHYLNTLEKPTYIFTSLGGNFGIFASKYLHRRFRKVPLIVDFRDHMDLYRFTPKYVIWISKILKEQICKEADRITAISKGICQGIPRKYWRKLHCVTNGFDSEERKNISVNNESHNKLRITYTGAMYGGLFSLSPFFRNLKVLVDRGKINLNKIEFCFAGRESAYEVFISEAREYGLDGNCVYYGRITRKESLKLQVMSDILLAASFNTQIERGIITGKVLEYMGTNKPIVAIINGDMPHSELGEIINGAKLGFAYEEAEGEESNDKLRKYFLEKYLEFMEDGRLVHNPNKEVLKKFDYKYLSDRMLKIIESTKGDQCEENHHIRSRKLRKSSIL